MLISTAIARWTPAATDCRRYPNSVVAAAIATIASCFETVAVEVIVGCHVSGC